MKKSLLFFLLVSNLNFCLAQAGRLDPTFGVNGITTTDMGSVAKFNRIGKQVLVQSDSALYFISEKDKIMHITKKYLDGTPDLTFGNKGNSVPVLMYVVQASLQTDGKIVVVGSYTIPGQQYNNTRIIIARFNTNGSLDNTFSGDGLATPSYGYNEQPTSMAFQKDGKIVIAGYYSNNSVGYGYQFLLYRLNADGTFDQEFSSVSILANDHTNFYTAITIQEDGKILAASSKFDTVSNSFVIALIRYKVDGNIDTVYSTGQPPSVTVGFNSKFITILKSGKIIVAGDFRNDFALAIWSKEGVFETIITTDFNGNNDLLTGFALQKNEDIILSGSSQINNTSSFAIAKFTPDLKPDKSFGEAGKLLTKFNTDKNFLNAVAVQTDNKVLAIGYVIIGVDKSTAIARYNTDGTLDKSFANNGMLIENINQGSTKYTCIAVQNDGKIITGGTTLLNNNMAFAIARYNTNGELDHTFGTGGIQINDFGNSNNSLNAIALQSDGKIVVGGSGNDSFLIARYNNDGSLDKAFANSGVKKDLFFKSDYINAIVIQPDGKILAGGSELVRYKTDGSFDSSFNDIGRTISIFPHMSIFNCVSIKLQKSGEILVLNNYKYQVPAVIKYFNNGRLDSSFGEYGQVPIYSIEAASGQSLLLQKDGKILVGGYLEQVDRLTNSSYIVTRLNNDGTTDVTFNEGQAVRTSILMRDYGRSLQIQDDNKIVLAGYSLTEEARDVFSMVRYNTDGSLDSSFNTNGKVTTKASGANSRIEAIYISGNNLYAAGYGEYPNNFGVLAKYLLCTTNNASPMKLINFKGAIQNKNVNLNWQIENEKDLKYFDVEKSSDALNFIAIKSIIGKGNSALITDYSAFDDQPSKGKNYYRLKMVKNDRSFTYSQMINANLCDEVTVITIYPNPATNRLFITNNGVNEKATLEIIDNTGIKVKEIKTTLNASTSIDIYTLPLGIYSLKISTKTSSRIIKFIKE